MTLETLGVSCLAQDSSDVMVCLACHLKWCFCVEQAGKEVQKAVVNMVGLVRGGVSNMATKVKQHQDKMKEGREERRLKRKDRKPGLPWARKRRRAKGNEGRMFMYAYLQCRIVTCIKEVKCTTCGAGLRLIL